MNEREKQRVLELVREEIDVVEYDPSWPGRFYAEKQHLLACLPGMLVHRVEHIGSTAVPGLASKPVIDMLVEVGSLDETVKKVVPILIEQGYDYFWRPSFGDDVPPFYAWFVKRDSENLRTHHIHMVERHFKHWERLSFRDYLIENPRVAEEYAELKKKLSVQYRYDRAAYTEAKGSFIREVTRLAVDCYGA